MIREACLNFRLREWCSKQNAPIGSSARELSDRNVGCSGERSALLNGRTATIGEHKAAVAAILRHTIRKGERKHGASGKLILLRRRHHLSSPTLSQLPRARSARRAVAAELVEAMVEIDTVASETAFGENGGNFGGVLAVTEARGIHDHAREARRQAALEAYEAARAGYRAAVLTALREVADTLTALEADARTLTAAMKAEDLARQALDASEVQYRAGGLPYASLLLAQTQYASASLTRLSAQIRRLTDTASLLQALGGPWSFQ